MNMIIERYSLHDYIKATAFASSAFTNISSQINYDGISKVSFESYFLLMSGRKPMGTKHFKDYLCQ